MLIWSSTENVVTLMCASIPVLRPLYARIKYGSKGDSYSNSRSYPMPHYGSKKYALGSNPGDGDRGGHHTAAVSFNGANASDEEILRGTRMQQDQAAGIKRTDEIQISFEQHGKGV